jgi:hypothetical protein
MSLFEARRIPGLGRRPPSGVREVRNGTGGDLAWGIEDLTTAQDRPEDGTGQQRR